MRNKKKAYMTLALMLLVGMAEANPVSLEDASQVANHFWRSALQGRGELHRVEWPYSEVMLFTSESGGWVMVSADDCARPIIGYSREGRVDEARLPVQLAARMEAYCGLVAAGMQQGIVASNADADRWRRMLSSVPCKDGEAGVGPLLETHWHQDGGYALLTPQHTPTGCAATAQSQMMRYWRYPAFGQGSETYNCQPYGAQSADFGHTLYDWVHMPEQVSTASPQVEQMAVSTLMYHVGVSLHMGYAEGGSGAAGLAGRPGVASIDNSLMDYFHYSRRMRAIFRTAAGWTDQRWTDSLVAELQLRHPIVYCGVAPEGGHGFVCDGYEVRDGQVWFHFNFGWSGNGDGYYTVDDICPNVSPTGTIGPTYHFNQSNQALLGAVPDYGMHVSDSLLTFTRDGGQRQMLFCSNDTAVGTWSVSANETWVTVDADGVDHAGWITINVAPNTTGGERQATVTFTQAGESISVAVVQTYYSEDDYCPLTVVMESTQGGGWENGAYLSFESPSGYVYNTARLASGGYDSVQVGVPPHDVDVVFHHGGGTDRYINYRVRNHYGELVVDVTYAFMNGGRHHMEWPCAPLDVDRPDEAPAQVLCTEVYDLQGRLLQRSTAAGQLRPLAATPGVYLVRTVTDRGVTTQKVLVTAGK